jgi:serine/threonine protein phosphatase PrpC
MVLIRDNIIRWGHVGDTRLYLIKDQKILFQTLDHSMAQMMVAADEIKAEEIRGHPDRNILTKALGQDNPYSRPTLGVWDKGESPDAIVLATDGFWELIAESRLISIIYSILNNAKDNKNQIFQRLDNVIKEKTVFKKDYDNYSIVIVMFIR